MTTTTTIRPIQMMGAALALGLAVGCESSTGPNEAVAGLDLDVAVMAAEATIDDVQSMSLATWQIAAPASAVPGFNVGGGMAPDDQLERSRTVTYFDQGGNVMDEFVQGETESILIVVDVEGSVERAHWSANIDRHRELTVSGLADDDNLREWNGQGSSIVSQSRHSDEFGDRQRTMTATSAIENVVVATPRDENPWPLSGTITKQVTVEIHRPDGDATRQRTVVITFNGTQFVTMKVNGEDFEVDLGDRDGRRPRRIR